MMALQYAAYHPTITRLPSQGHPVAVRTLHVLLYLLIFASFYTFIEPSPYEILVVPLLLACFAARVQVDIKVMPLVLLLLILEIGGFASLMQVPYDGDAQKFIFISTYLAVTAVIFAILFSEDSVRRIAILRSAYILAAVIASIVGIIGYFQLFPGTEALSYGGRAISTFTDPNIFGPFLILPLLLIVERFIAGIVRIHYILAGAIMLVGLLLAFSRAAWANFVVSAALMLVLLYVTSPNARMRSRLIVFSFAALVIVSALLAGLYSIEEVRLMIEKRFTLLQEYDVGTSASRFSIQEKSLEEILNNPNGMGPWVFGKKYGSVSHNSYLGTMLNHGWIGGIAYFLIVLATLAFGFRALLVHTPWQPVLVAAYAAFFGLALESFVVDTDHWRHWYLLLGMVWGLSVASVNAQARSRSRSARAVTPSPTFRIESVSYPTGGGSDFAPASPNNSIRYFRL